ncbi:hypothetical protein SKAU_G00040650, partial [Synaphobranchus kaupii]
TDSLWSTLGALVTTGLKYCLFANIVWGLIALKSSCWPGVDWPSFSLFCLDDSNQNKTTSEPLKTPPWREAGGGHSTSAPGHGGLRGLFTFAVSEGEGPVKDGRRMPGADSSLQSTDRATARSSNTALFCHDSSKRGTAFSPVNINTDSPAILSLSLSLIGVCPNTRKMHPPFLHYHLLSSSFPPLPPPLIQYVFVRVYICVCSPRGQDQPSSWSC